MVFDFESVTEKSKMACFHKCSCPIKHVTCKVILYKKKQETSSNSILTEPYKLFAFNIYTIYKQNIQNHNHVIMIII